MKISKLIVCLFAASIFTPVSVVASEAVDSPEALIRTIYADHQPWNKKEINIKTRTSLSKYFDSELTDLFMEMWAYQAKTSDLCSLNADPFLDAQDYGDNLNPDLQIRALSDTSPVFFEVTFKLFNEMSGRKKLHYQLRNTGHGWRVSDIVYVEHPGYSLKGELRASKEMCIESITNEKKNRN